VVVAGQTAPDAIVGQGVVAIARRVPPARLAALAAALGAEGIRALEITLDSHDALSSIARLTAAADGMSIGAGTVLCVHDAELAVAAGARFLVTPALDPDVVRWARDHDIPVLPGATTPTEILAAWRAGASAVKLFPAGALGPAYLRQLRGPFPDIPLVPTGGIHEGNAGDFLAAGASALAVGAALVGDAEPGGVARRARALRGLVQAAR
jgi:2-dehydro-3-deoxyphosphogluconate aldolase/(4S)-4-hydroxy-2-oxoglutarate aldolase